MTKLREFKEGITGFEKLEYEERLRRLILTTLQDKRMRGDLIETYKVLSNRASIDWVKLLNLKKKRGYIFLFYFI